MSDKFFIKIDEKLDKIIEDLTDVKIVQAKQAVIQEKHEENLQQHMEASRTLKALYNDLKEKEIEPIKADLNKFKGALKVLGFLGSIAGIVFGIIKHLAK